MILGHKLGAVARALIAAIQQHLRLPGALDRESSTGRPVCSKKRWRTDDHGGPPQTPATQNNQSQTHHRPPLSFGVKSIV